MLRRSIVAFSVIALFVPLTEALAEHASSKWEYYDEVPITYPQMPQKSHREQERDYQRGENYKKWMNACNEGGGRAAWGTKDEDPDAFGGIAPEGESPLKPVCSCVSDAAQKRLDEVKPYREGVPDTGPKMEDIVDTLPKIRPLAKEGEKVCAKDPATEARKERERKMIEADRKKEQDKKAAKEKKERVAKEKAEEKAAKESQEKENQAAYEKAQETKRKEAEAVKAKKDAALAALRERWDKYRAACALGGGMAVSGDIDRQICYCDQNGEIKFMASRATKNYCANARAKEAAQDKKQAEANRAWCAREANADYNHGDKECVCRIRSHITFAVGKGNCGSDAYQRSMYYSFDTIEAGVVGAMKIREKIRGDGSWWPSLPSIPRIPIFEPWGE